MERRRGHVLAGLTAAWVLTVTAAGCSEDDATDSSATSSTLGSSDLAPLSGTLGGTTECPWLDAGEQRFMLVLPEGVAARSSDAGLELIDADGSVVGREAQELEVVGGTSTDVSPASACGGEGVGAVFRVGQLGPR